MELLFGAEDEIVKGRHCWKPEKGRRKKMESTRERTVPFCLGGCWSVSETHLWTALVKGCYPCSQLFNFN